MENKSKPVEASPLGKSSAYLSNYQPDLLFPIPRQEKREEIAVPDVLPFKGFDHWHAFELSWLNSKGKPVVALAEFIFDCHSSHIIESKSLKLYLNSFNQTKFPSLESVQQTLEKDLKQAANGSVQVKVAPLSSYLGQALTEPQGICLDELDIAIDNYQLSTDSLSADKAVTTEETLVSHLLKSNCLVTGQPDWGSVEIRYQGPKIHHEGLLRYLISFRNHNEFHEQCVERIFMDLRRYCQPKQLTVKAYYTRRGGLDINPVRSTETVLPEHMRTPRQ